MLILRIFEKWWNKTKRGDIEGVEKYSSVCTPRETLKRRGKYQEWHWRGMFIRCYRCRSLLVCLFVSGWWKQGWKGEPAHPGSSSGTCISGGSGWWDRVLQPCPAPLLSAWSVWDGSAMHQSICTQWQAVFFFQGTIWLILWPDFMLLFLFFFFQMLI